MLVLCQTRTPESERLQIRGIFTQKKKLWETLAELEPGLETLVLLDDVSGKKRDANYTKLCAVVATVGRATLLGQDGRRKFLIVSVVPNQLRNWDTDDDGKPQLNPVKKDEETSDGTREEV